LNLASINGLRLQKGAVSIMLGASAFFFVKQEAELWRNILRRYGAHARCSLCSLPSS
jgi:hypothetical protein